MWDKIATFILKQKAIFLIAILAFTGVMGYYATKVELEYQLQRLAPKNDPDLIAYNKFQKTFGMDHNKVVIGFSTDKLFQLKHFNQYKQMCDSIAKIHGVKTLLSPTNLYNLALDTAGKFKMERFAANPPKNQAELDSLHALFLDMKFYQGLLYNANTNASLMVVSLDDKVMDSENRITLIKDIQRRADQFGAEVGAEAHMGGLPFVRTEMATSVKAELVMFTVVAFLVTAILILVFFRSFSTLAIAILFIAIGVIVMFGISGMLGYKINLLTGTLPPLLVVIGVQNAVYLINKYHEEYRKHGNKAKALTRIISRVGVATFLINFTTAVGFGTFYFTKTQILEQYGVVSFITINLVFFINIIGIPALYSLLPVPSDKQVAHLDNGGINKFLSWVKFLVFNRKRRIYFWFIAITVVATTFVFKLHPLAYMVDDVPKSSKMYKDMQYFQDNFKGILPYEILIRTHDESEVTNFDVLDKANRLQKALKKFPEFAKPTSLVEVLCYGNQMVNEGDPAFYRLPNALAMSDVAGRMPEAKAQAGSMQNAIVRGLMDSSHTTLRISYQVRDVGSVSMDSINQEVYKILDRVFPPEEYTTQITGSVPVFLKGNSYLYGSLGSATFWSLIIITITMGFLFPSIRMIIIAVIPNIIPLLVTAGTMGYFDIPLKPSTILVFSIAFGITVDATIHFIITFRRELVKHNRPVREALNETIVEVGVSMIYSMVAICAGFLIFTFSSFQGTQALGWLTGLTLLTGMAANLFLLPALILSLEKSLNPKEELAEQVLELPDENED
ncbi:MAG: efflux RND transporter permease subunit [Bacteroidota bacterium]